ncbi:odorant receptor 63a-like [Culex pipiens pallens]|uniref:odorant receptor 63a-like n=1 Tax=Culex pipiens pallens TaxID=42434 RepID=UPI0019547C1A|nr:odorant receptor 63a-like [Culex pipiens pallens]
MGVCSAISSFFTTTAPNYHGTYAVYRVFMFISGVNFFDDDFMVGPLNMARFLGPAIAAILGTMSCMIHLHRYLDEVDQVILSLAAFFSGTELLIKMCGMALKRNKGAELLAVILNDRSYDEGPVERAIFVNYHGLARTLMFITIFSYPFTALMLISYPVIAGKLGEFLLPMGFSIPFISHKQHPWYEINYLIEVVQMLWCVIAFIGLDGPFYIYVCYATCKMEVMKTYIEQIGDSEDVEQQRGLLRKIIGIHTHVLQFLRDCSDFYQEIYLAQVFFSIAHICVSLFHVQLKLKNSSYGMLATNVAKMWIFCYCGELVVTKANEVCEAMYANRWYRLWRKDDLRTVRFVLANTQQKVGFSIGGFRFLSYDAFTEIMKTAYSCNAFLHNMLN